MFFHTYVADGTALTSLLHGTTSSRDKRCRAWDNVVDHTRPVRSSDTMLRPESRAYDIANTSVVGICPE